MPEKLYTIISTHEHKVKILSIEYDETLAPWQLKFFLTLQYNEDLTNFNIRIIFIIIVIMKFYNRLIRIARIQKGHEIR